MSSKGPPGSGPGWPKGSRYSQCETYISLGSLWELRQFPGNGLFTGFDVNTSRNAEKDKRGSTRKAALPSRGKGVVGQRATGNCSF